MLYITHDLASARYVADRTTVMFAGELVESAPSIDLMDDPAHPYTQLLMSAVPDPDRAGTFDPGERARQRAAVLRATTCPFDGDPDRPCSTTAAVRHTVGQPGRPPLGALPPLSTLRRARCARASAGRLRRPTNDTE